MGSKCSFIKKQSNIFEYHPFENNYNNIYDENQMVYYKYCCCDDLFDFSCCYYYSDFSYCDNCCSSCINSCCNACCDNSCHDY